MVLSVVLALGFFFVGYFLIGAIFCLFAFQNFDAYRRARVLTESDRNVDITGQLKEVEDLLESGNKEAAIPKLEEVRAKAKKGVIFNLTSQYLAAFKAEKQDFQGGL